MNDDNFRLELSTRQKEIVRLVRDSGFATLEGLAQYFEVSVQTIRRDVIFLNKSNILQRFHGGAGLPADNVRFPYIVKRSMSANAKERIAKKLADVIPDGTSLALDVGTTIEALARALRGKRGLKVICVSLPTAFALAGVPEIEIFLAGGTVAGPDGSLVGEETLQSLRQFRTDMAIIACSGFDEDGSVMDFDLQKIANKRVMIHQSKSAVLAADSSKFERSAMARIDTLDQFSILATDKKPPVAFLEHARRSNVRLLIAD